MHRGVVLGFIVVLLAAQSGFCMEQTVEAIVPRGEQQVVPIGPRGDQVVQEVPGGAVQQVDPQEPPSAAAKAASNVAKGATAVAAAAVSLGAMAAMLLFL